MSIVISSVPYIETDEMIMAPALLKSIAHRHGFESTTIDLNIDVIHQIQHNPHKNGIINFFYTQNYDEKIIKDIDFIIDYCVNRILENSPKLVALSLLAYTCQVFTIWLCAKLKHQDTNIKIVIGGTGIKETIGEISDNFCSALKNYNLIDDFIHGDAELAFPEYLKGNTDFPGINSVDWKNQGFDLNDNPYPDYNDYNFSLYTKLAIPINDSRGCVKNCEFCDIIEFWTKFKWRSAENVFAEMLHQIKKYNIFHFVFRNSLINGNLKEFKKLVDLIGNYNLNKSREKQISWESYFIIRSKSYHPPELWEKLKLNNATLYLGVESVIPSIRVSMGKPYTNEDLDWHLEAAKNHNVFLTLLMIVGYPQETLLDYEFTKTWFRERKHYVNNTVSWLNLSMASILVGTALDRKSEEYGIKKSAFPGIWINTNLKITTTQRMKYYNELKDICINECGFKILGTQEKQAELVINHSSYEQY